MKKTLIGSIVAALLILAIGGLGLSKLRQATQYGGGHGAAPQLTVVMTVRVNTSFLQDTDHAAAALWLTCTGSITGTAGPVRRHGDGTYSAVLAPSLASDTERRLVGCLQDLTIDNVRGAVLLHRDQPVEALYDDRDRVRIDAA